MTTRTEIELTINKVRALVMSLPKSTPQVVHNIVQYLLDICTEYQKWVNDLQKMVTTLEDELQQMRKNAKSN